MSVATNLNGESLSGVHLRKDTCQMSVEFRSSTHVMNCTGEESQKLFLLTEVGHLLLGELGSW